MLTIQDQELAERLRELSARENQPIEGFLRLLLSRYEENSPEEQSLSQSPPSQTERIRRTRLKVYADARRYWELHDNPARAALTDEQLDEQFWYFDRGVPCLHGDDVQPPSNPLLEMAISAREQGLELDSHFAARDSRAILEQDLADDLIRRRSNG